MRARTSFGIGLAHVDAVDQRRCRTADRRSAGSARRSCSCRRPTGRRSPPSRRASTAKLSRAAPAGRGAPDRRSETSSKAIAPVRVSPAAASGLAGAAMAGFSASSSARRSAAPAAWREFAPDLRQRAERAGGEHRIEQELAERARATWRRTSTSREPNHSTADDRGEDREDRDEGEDARAQAPRSAPPRRRLRRRREKRPVTSASLVKACKRAHRADLLAGIGGRAGQRVLRGARLAAHRAAEGDQRQHDQRDRGDHQAGQLAGW